MGKIKGGGDSCRKTGKKHKNAAYFWAGGKGVWENAWREREDCFVKANNATRPTQRDDASIVPYKLLAVLKNFSMGVQDKSA